MPEATQKSSQKEQYHNLVTKSKKLTQQTLKELLHYNPDTGVFTWKETRGCRPQDSVAGYVNSRRGYRTIHFNGKYYRAHRLAWLYMEGYFPTNLDVDHINHSRDDNRWANLRIVSRSCNLRNSKVRKGSVSGVTGVTWNKSSGKWLAYVRHDGANLLLGFHKNLISAVIARFLGEIAAGYEACQLNSSARRWLINQNVTKIII